MRGDRWLIGAAVVFQFVVSGPQVWACTAAGPNGHIGEAVNVNPSARVIEIRDGQSGSPLIFRATPEQLSGIRRGDRVLIKFKDDGGALIAEEVQVLP